jgi:hypothetical protein
MYWDADPLTRNQVIGINTWVGGNDRCCRCTKPGCQLEDGVSGLDGIKEPWAYRRNRAWCRPDWYADYLADLQIIGIYPRIGGLDGLNSSPEPLRQPKERITGLNGIQESVGTWDGARCGTSWDADYLADLQVVGINPWVGGLDCSHGSPKPLRQPEECVT